MSNPSMTVAVRAEPNTEYNTIKESKKRKAHEAAARRKHTNENEIDSRDPKNRNLLLLKISPVLLINQNQIQIIPSRKLLVDIPERRREFESSQKQSDRDRLSSNRSAVHDFKFGNGF